MSETISSAEYEALDWAVRAPMRILEAWSLKDLDPREAHKIGEVLLKLNAARAELHRAHEAALSNEKEKG